MQRRVTRWFWVGLSVLAVLAGPSSSTIQAQTDDLGYSRLVRPTDSDFYHTPLGLCEDYPEETTTSEIIRGDMEFLDDTGVDLLRISFGWDGIEGEKDQYDWLFWDEFVDTAVDSFGVTLIPYICYTPLWNSTTDDPDNAWHYPPKDYDEYGQFVYDLVSRYKDRIKTWELWNEPDIWIFWAGNQEEFTKLIKAGSEAVRRADPEAKTVLGGLAHDTEWLESLLRDHGVGQYVDIYNMHNYFETWAGKPLEEITDYVNEVHRIVKEYGGDKPLWMAEVGYSTFRDSSFVSDGYSAYYSYEHRPPYQAVDLVRRIVSVLSTEKLSAVAWYEIKDLTAGEATIGDFGNNGNLGIARADWEPKPAQKALRFLNQLMMEPTRSIDGEIKLEQVEDSEAHVHAFERENGDILVFAWLQTFVPDRRIAVGDGYHKDGRAETVAVGLPKAISGPIVRYNELGDLIDAAAISDAVTDATLHLTLRGGSIEILEIKAAP